MLGSRRGGPADRRTVLEQFLRTMRRVAGMPDYAAHVEHLRHCHPGQPIPTERKFYQDYVRARYEDGPTRCC